MTSVAESYDEQWSRLYDFIRFNPGARHRRRLIQEAVRRTGLLNPSVVDVGCGPGFTVQAISEVLPRAQITGLDFSDVAIDGARSRFPQHSWVVGDLMKPLSQRPADVVICTEVIEHLTEWESGLKNVLDLVGNHGFLILTTQSGKVHATERFVGHERHFRIEELLEVLKQHSFTIVISQNWGWPGYVFLKHIANVRSDMTIDAFGSGRYGFLARLLNRLAYFFSSVFSLRNHKRGSQIVILAKRRHDST
jgi:ubiquinone/menaquinone biosynthesis C-methylase UbiE